MGRGLHSPFPASLRCESKKATRILESFTNPSTTGGPGIELPKSVLANAKGLVIFTALRAGFLGSVRFGSGVMVARLDNGSWSTPSAIAMVGGGFGGQIGVELTDFVFILNDQYAVRTFSQMGSLTLGGNISFAAGPVGRSVEVAGGASPKGLAAIFAYSKTKGIFAGVTIEGGILMERRSANRKLYRSKVNAAELLRGLIPPPSEVQTLVDILSMDVFYPKDTKMPDNLPRDGTIELPTGTQNQPPSELLAEHNSQPPVFELPAESSLTLPVNRPVESPPQRDNINAHSGPIAIQSEVVA